MDRTLPGTALCILLAACTAPPDEALPSSTERGATPLERSFPTPTGPYGVGMQEHHWTDTARTDVFTGAVDDGRRVPVRIWYPADPDPGSVPAPYVLDLEEFAGVDAIQEAADIPTHAALDAQVATDGGPFPLLLYNHGGGWPRFTGTFIGEELASHGYIVAAVGHDGFNQSTHRPDGSPTAADALPFPEETDDLKATALAAWDHLEKHHFPQWISDNLYALSRLEAMAADGGSAFAGRIDLDRVGALGWSFGGAASIQLVSQDRRFKAAVDMDGQLFGDAHERGSDRPYMLMKSTSLEPPPADTDEERERNRRILDELLTVVEARENAFIASSSGEGYRLEIAGTTHATFSDFLHLAPDTIGSIGTERGHELLTVLVRAFFDRYLKGEAVPILDDLASFPEVTAERTP